MLRKFSQDPVKNPGGWMGKNWKNSGYDVIAYFPEFPEGSGSEGIGPFRVDYAATFNDFITYTNKLQPVAIISFGQGSGPWEIEVNFPAYYSEFFSTGMIPSTVGEKIRFAIPESLKVNITRKSSLPLEKIQNEVNKLRDGPKAWIDKDGDAGSYLCGYLGYLATWYHDQHKSKVDPAQNLAAGFIHVGAGATNTEAAVEATLDGLLMDLPSN